MPSPRRYQEPCELRSRLQYLFETGEGTDCRILVEREEGSEDGPAEFNAHRAVLLASSVPLRMLLLQASSNSDALPTIRLKDVSPEAFAACLSYIYSGKIGPVTPANAVDIFIAADRLDLPVLRKRAEHYLPRAISTATVGQHLRKAVHAKQMQLVAFCSAFIGRHFDAFLQTTAFLGLPQSILVALLSSPEICVENEDKVRKQVKWRRRSLNCRAVFQHVFFAFLCFPCRFLSLCSAGASIDFASRAPQAVPWPLEAGSIIIANTRSPRAPPPQPLLTLSCRLHCPLPGSNCSLLKLRRPQSPLSLPTAYTLIHRPS